MMKRERLLLLLSALLLALFTGIGCRSGQAEAPAPPETEEQATTVRPETTEEEKKPESAPEAETSETSEEPEKPEESAPPAHEGIWTPSELENTLGGADPIEGFNRAMFSCTDFIMNYFVDPVGRVYTSILPRPVIEKFNNLCVNLEFPTRAFSCLFRAEWQGAGDETARFLINTTLGIAGLFDPAAHWFDFYSTESDFGQTFAAWGIGPGCTLILPLMSTLNVRDTVASIFDMAFDIKTYIPYAGYATALNRMVIAHRATPTNPIGNLRSCGGNCRERCTSITPRIRPPPPGRRRKRPKRRSKRPKSPATPNSSTRRKRRSPRCCRRCPTAGRRRSRRG